MINPPITLNRSSELRSLMRDVLAIVDMIKVPSLFNVLYHFEVQACASREMILLEAGITRSQGNV